MSLFFYFYFCKEGPTAKVVVKVVETGVKEGKVHWTQKKKREGKVLISGYMQQRNFIK